MADPTAATREAGIRTETNEFISPADITETLYCIRECLDGSKIQQTFADALSMAGGSRARGQEGGDMEGQEGVTWKAKKAAIWAAKAAVIWQGGNNGFVTSPYADVGEYLKKTLPKFAWNVRGILSNIRRISQHRYY